MRENVNGSRISKLKNNFHIFIKKNYNINKNNNYILSFVCYPPKETDEKKTNEIFRKLG